MMPPASLQKQCPWPPDLLWAELASLEHGAKQINGKVKGKQNLLRLRLKDLGNGFSQGVKHAPCEQNCLVSAHSAEGTAHFLLENLPSHKN